MWLFMVHQTLYGCHCDFKCIVIKRRCFINVTAISRRLEKLLHVLTQVNRMCRSRRVLATGGKQRIFGLDMVFIETILFHLDSF